MRYEDRLPQTEIARSLGLSEATVSRCLKEAMDLGFVEIRVAAAGLRDSGLEERLARRFGLVRTVVVRAPGDAGTAPAPLAEAVARVVEDLMEPGTVIGVSDGDTVAGVAHAVRRGRSPDVDIVTLVGGVGRAGERSHSSEVARAMAAGSGGRAWVLPVPAVADDAATAQALRGMSAVREVMEKTQRLDVALVGIGDVSSHATLFRHGVVGVDRLKSLVAAGAAGTVCARFYDREGRPIATELDARTMSVPAAALMRAPVRLAVACGRHKAPAILAALKGGIVNALGTDAETASLLIDAP